MEKVYIAVYIIGGLAGILGLFATLSWWRERRFRAHDQRQRMLDDLRSRGA
jgi:hypothetical protein